MFVLPQRWSNRLHFVFRVGVLLYVVVCTLLYFFQEKLLFHPTSLAQDYKFDLKLPFEEKVVTAEGEQIHSLLVHPAASRGLILYFHGNMDNLSSWGHRAEDLANKLQYDVWMMDYPGYGKSSGRVKSEAQLQGIAQAVFLEAKKAAGTKPIFVYGRSLGSGLAVKVAAENAVNGLVMESAYSSIQSVSRLQYPWAPGFLLRYPLNSASWMPQVKTPVLFLHGDSDEVIYYSEGQALAVLAPHGRLVTILGGHHNDLSYHKEYWAELATYFTGTASPPAP